MAHGGIVHQFPGGSEAQYEASIAAAHPSDGSLPEGQLFHAAGPAADGWMIVAINESEERWEPFRDGTLMPLLQAGIDVASTGRRSRHRWRSTTSSGRTADLSSPGAVVVCACR